MRTRLLISFKVIVILGTLILASASPVLEQGRLVLRPEIVWANDLGAWEPTSSMTTPRFWHGAATVGQYIYAVGGRPEPTPGNDNGFDTIERATINGDGTLGAWGILTSTMTLGRYLVPIVTTHGYMYAVGGHDNFGSYLTSVERAPIQPDGTLGAWQVISNMTTGRYAHAAIVIGDYLYALGGYTGTWDNSVERAFINGDGTLGAWELISTMTTGREDAAVVYWNGYIYAIGGHNPNTLSSVERAIVNPDGTLGTWELMSSLVHVRTRASGFAVDGYIYVIGGSDDLTSVERTVINGDGTLGTWEVISNTSTPRSNMKAAYADGHFYALGGLDAANTTLASVEMTEILGGGEPPVSAIAVAQDTFLRSGDLNTNEGANLNMVVRASGHNRALVAFDVAALAPIVGEIDTVSLRLYVVDNGNNWGNTGRTLDVHSATGSWVEGDGANLQPGNLTSAQFNPYRNRGDGPGVTWKCAADSEVHNQQTNCNPHWNGGTYVVTATDTITIYKDFGGNNSLPPTTKTMGWVQFDVTNDVLACLGNSTMSCGWLIKKTLEGQEGLVEFATKEGAQAIYDALLGESVAPRLEISYQGEGAQVGGPPSLFMPQLGK